MEVIFGQTTVTVEWYSLNVLGRNNRNCIFCLMTETEAGLKAMLLLTAIQIIRWCPSDDHFLNEAICAASSEYKKNRQPIAAPCMCSMD
jgi:hypothetical protein